MYLTHKNEWHVKNEINQKILTLIHKHEHEHGMEQVMMYLVHGLVIVDGIRIKQELLVRKILHQDDHDEVQAMIVDEIFQLML